MTAQPPAERKAAERKRRAQSGLKRVEVYVPAGQAGAIRAYASLLCRHEMADAEMADQRAEADRQ